jgi:hypothetical protein
MVDLRHVLGIAAVAIMAVAVPTASATLPGKNGSLVFKRYFVPDQWGRSSRSVLTAEVRSSSPTPHATLRTTSLIGLLTPP